MKWINRLENLFCGLLILIVTGILFVNVVLRYGFNAGTTWAEEAIRYGFIWITFIGAAICVRQTAHVNINILPNKLRGKSKKALSLFVIIVPLIFMAWVTKIGWDVVMFSYNSGQISPSLGLPIYIVYLAVPIGGLLMVVHYIELIMKWFKSGAHDDVVELDVDKLA